MMICAVVCMNHFSKNNVMEKEKKKHIDVKDEHKEQH